MGWILRDAAHAPRLSSKVEFNNEEPRSPFTRRCVFGSPARFLHLSQPACLPPQRNHTVDGWGKSYTDIIVRSRGRKEREREKWREASRRSMQSISNITPKIRTEKNCLPVPKSDCGPQKPLSRSLARSPWTSCFPRFNYRIVTPQICALLMNLDDCASAMPSLCDICAAGSSPRPSSRPPRFQFPSQGKQNDGIDIPSIFDL